MPPDTNFGLKPKSIMKTPTILKSLAVAVLLLPCALQAKECVVADYNITPAEVEKAQKAWGKALVSISKAYESGGIEKATETARAVINKAYAYDVTPVLFKPTLTVNPQTFRTTKDGALAYFVGGNKDFPNDEGFALKGWRSCQVENAGMFISGELAITMGKVRLTDKNGKITEVDKTWAFKKDDSGNLRIVLHHSSLPYNP
jgi:hypothetical protein